MKDLIKISFLGVLVIALLIPITAHGTVITYEFNLEFSEGVPPGGSTPWVTATFDDEFDYPDENVVRLTISAVNLVGQETITEFYLNFHPDYNPAGLTFTPFDNSASEPLINLGIDAFRADGDGWFDILFDLPPPAPGDYDHDKYFTAGEEIIYDISYFSGDYVIDATSFNFKSVGGDKGGFNAAAKIQRIDDPDFSGWIAPHCIPEPATVLLLGSLLIGIGVLKRKNYNR